VIRNLLSNAVKYGGPGSTVQIAAERADAGVAIRVLDDGPGFDDAAVEHLFDLYYRAPGAASTAPGAGIGLFVCRQIVSALGGTIWARPRPEGGAEFGFRLPIYEADDEPTRSSPIGASSRRRPDRRPAAAGRPGRTGRGGSAS
jgi:signal transduction histidine kinase